MRINQKKLKTIDDWCPNFPNDYVEVSLIEDSKTTARVTVWGEDDMGMEKCFDGTNSLTDAFACFHSLHNPVTQYDLKQRGFILA